jgi:ERCC4-related helicase
LDVGWNLGSHVGDQTREEALDEGEPPYLSMPLIKRGSVAKRKYQEEIFEACKDVNSLIVLPTGLGKTVIAAMLAAHRLLVYPTSKIVFLAPTRPLVKQQRDTFLRVLDLEYEDMRLLTGEKKAKVRASMWCKARVVFATPQVLAVDLSKGEYDLRNVSLIIFDEAHRAIGNYAYVGIAREYFRQAKDPQTIGLTASPGWSQESISEIERNLRLEHMEARNEASMDVAHFVHPLEIQWVRVQLGPELTLVGRLIDEMMDERLNALLEYGLIKEEDLHWRSRRAMIDLLGQLRAETRKGPTVAPMAYYQGLILSGQVIRLSHCEELLNTQGLYALHNYMEKAILKSKSPRSSNALKELTRDPRFSAVHDTIKNLLDRGVKHPKLIELLRILKEEINQKPNSRILVFAQIRDTVKQIVDELRSKGISSSIFVGHGRGRGSAGMTQVKQVKVLRDFKDGLYSALVATSVAEEGLDIAECDLVVMYDAVPSEVRYIQRRGRASRHREGRVVTLITAGTQDERYYLSAVSKEKKMRDTILRVKEDEAMKIEDFVFDKSDKNNETVESDKREGDEQGSSKSSVDTTDSPLKEQSTLAIGTTDQLRTVILDKSLGSSEMYMKLKKSGLNPILRSTIAADYIIGDEVGVIHIKHETLKENRGAFERLCQRVDSLRELFVVPLVINQRAKSNDKNAIQADDDSCYMLAAYLTLAKRVHFFQVDDEEEAANLIHSFARVSL